MPQKWLTYQNISERIRFKRSALHFSFSALFFIGIWSRTFVNIKTDLNFFSIRTLMKNSSDLIKNYGWASLPYGFNFILIGESYLCYENAPTSIIFSRVGKRCFFRKKCDNHEKNKRNSMRILNLHSSSHIVYKFQKDWMKKNAYFATAPLKVAWGCVVYPVDDDSFNCSLNLNLFFSHIYWVV